MLPKTPKFFPIAISAGHLIYSALVTHRIPIGNLSVTSGYQWVTNGLQMMAIKEHWIRVVTYSESASIKRGCTLDF